MLKLKQSKSKKTGSHDEPGDEINNKNLQLSYNNITRETLHG